MASTIRIKNYDKSTNKDTEYKEVDERTPLPVVISGGVIGGTDGEIPVFDGNINIEAIGGEPVVGKLTVQLTPEQVAALRSPDTQAVSGTITVANQKLDVVLLNETVQVEGAVALTNERLDVNLTNPSVPVTDNGGSLTVDGTITVGNANLPVTFTNTSIVVSDGGEALTVKGSVALTNATIPVTDNGGSLTVDGTVNVGNTVPVLISNTALGVTVEPGTQPIYAKISDDGGSITVDGTVSTVPTGTQTVSGTVTAVPTGTQVVSGTVTTTPSGTQTVTGTVTANTSPPTLSATSSALTGYRNAAVLASPQSVKAAAGRLHQYHFGNPNSSTVFVHIYNALSANVTVGTTAPVATYMIAANAALDGYWPNSLNYTTGITVAATTTAAGATAPAVGVLVGLGYI